MGYFTARNTVILALLQVGVITAGVLAARVNLKWQSTLRLSQSSLTILLADFGWLAMILPVGWATLAIRVLRREESSDQAIMLVVLSGALLLIVMILTVWYAAGSQWLKLMQI
jgi:hypothetical protein